MVFLHYLLYVQALAARTIPYEGAGKLNLAVCAVCKPYGVDTNASSL